MHRRQRQVEGDERRMTERRKPGMIQLEEEEIEEIRDSDCRSQEIVVK